MRENKERKKTEKGQKAEQEPRQVTESGEAAAVTDKAQSVPGGGPFVARVGGAEPVAGLGIDSNRVD